jgi:hypothetical protein
LSFPDETVFLRIVLRVAFLAAECCCFPPCRACFYSQYDRCVPLAATVCCVLGATVCCFLGAKVCCFLGATVSCFLGATVSCFLGAMVSCFLGATVSCFLGTTVSCFLGATVSCFLRATVSCFLLTCKHLHDGLSAVQRSGNLRSETLTVFLFLLNPKRLLFSYSSDLVFNNLLYLLVPHRVYHLSLTACCSPKSSDLQLFYVPHSSVCSQQKRAVLPAP